MSARRESSERQLDTLQRLRELELQQARVERAAADAATEKQQERVNATEAEIKEAQRLAESHVTRGQGAAAELIRICTEYAKWQTHVLVEQQADLRSKQETSRLAQEPPAFWSAAHQLDALVCPTMGPAYLTDWVTGDHFTGSATTPSAVSGYPHVTVPAGFVRGLPWGLSILGPAWSDAKLVRYALAFERESRVRRAPGFLATVDFAAT